MNEPAKDEAELLRRIEDQSGWDGQWLIAPVDALTAIRKAGWAVVPNELDGWQPMDTAPRCGRSVLLFCTTHGQIEGRFSPAERYYTEYTEEYFGPVWVLGDDLKQVEIEEPLMGKPESHWHDGSIVRWRELHAAPGGKQPEPVCVNAHDRCYGGAGGPCPYCEVPAAPEVEPIKTTDAVCGCDGYFDAGCPACTPGVKP
jgi:hypothetical protein